MEYNAQNIGSAALVSPAILIGGGTYLAVGMLAAWACGLRPGSMRWAACMLWWPLLAFYWACRAIRVAICNRTPADTYDY